MPDLFSIVSDHSRYPRMRGAVTISISRDEEGQAGTGLRECCSGCAWLPSIMLLIRKDGLWVAGQEKRHEPWDVVECNGRDMLHRLRSGCFACALSIIGTATPNSTGRPALPSSISLIKEILTVEKDDLLQINNAYDHCDNRYARIKITPVTEKIIGTRLKSFRKKRGLSQEELSCLLGFKDRQTVSAIETGLRRMTG